MLLEDIGLVPYGKQGRKVHKGIFQCPQCLEPYTTTLYAVQTGVSTRCNACSKLNSSERLKVLANNQLQEARSTWITTVNNICVSQNISVYGEYVGAFGRMSAVCHATGCLHSWVTTPSRLKSGAGCPSCANKLHASVLKHYSKLHSTTINNEAKRTFTADINSIHGDKIVVLSDYVADNTKVSIRCSICSHLWEAVPSSLKQGHGCPRCAVRNNGSGFFKYTLDKCALYLVYFNDFNLYKIGISTKGVVQRLRNVQHTYTIIFELWYDIGSHAYTAEQLIIKDNYDILYYGPKLLKSKGDTELFTTKPKIRKELHEKINTYIRKEA